MNKFAVFIHFIDYLTELFSIDRRIEQNTIFSILIYYLYDKILFSFKRKRNTKIMFTFP